MRAKGVTPRFDAGGPTVRQSAPPGFQVTLDFTKTGTGTFATTYHVGTRKDITAMLGQIPLHPTMAPP